MSAGQAMTLAFGAVKNRLPIHRLLSVCPKPLEADALEHLPKYTLTTAYRTRPVASCTQVVGRQQEVYNKI